MFGGFGCEPISTRLAVLCLSGGGCLEEQVSLLARRTRCPFDALLRCRGFACSPNPGAAAGHPLVLPERLPRLLRQRADGRFGRSPVPAEERRKPVAVLPAGRPGRKRRCIDGSTRRRHCSRRNHNGTSDHGTGRTGLKGTCDHRPPAGPGDRAHAPGVRRRLQGPLRRRPHHRRRRAELPRIERGLSVGTLQEHARKARAEILEHDPEKLQTLRKRSYAEQRIKLKSGRWRSDRRALRTIPRCTPAR